MPDPGGIAPHRPAQIVEWWPFEADVSDTVVAEVERADADEVTVTLTHHFAEGGVGTIYLSTAGAIALASELVAAAGLRWRR